MLLWKKGFISWAGLPPPYRGPYIWKSMKTLHFNVELPSTFQTVTVHMMSDFLLESWISFATCEKKQPGDGQKMLNYTAIQNVIRIYREKSFKYPF